MSASPVMTDTVYTIGIDIGGTKVNASRIALGIDGGITPSFSFEDVQRLSTPHDPSGFMGALEQLIKQLAATAPEPIACVGISTAGIVDPREGKILGSTGNLPAIQHHPFDIKTPLQQATGIQVTVENDANAAAYGEYKVGAGKGFQNVLMVTLGTGVGTGLIVNGRLVHGGRFSAGEGGHVCISHTPERRCTCGLMDCWEAYASGPAMAETAKRRVAQDPNSPEAIALIGDEPVDSLTTHTVIHAWRGGNTLAQEIMMTWHTHIAAGLGGLINLLDPDITVVGGGMAQFVDFDLLHQALATRVMNCKPLSNLRVVPAELGNQAGMIGAAYLALEQTQRS